MQPYYLVYYRFNPEDDERIIVALVFQDNNKYKIVYDPEFPKIKRLYPKNAGSIIDMMPIYLLDLEDKLNSESELVMHNVFLLLSPQRKYDPKLFDESLEFLKDRFLR